MAGPSYDRFKERWTTRTSAEAYRQGRFSRSRRWRWTDRQERALVGRFLHALPLGSRVLDVPCGAERFVPLFRASKIQLVGVDISSQMLRVAREAFGPLALLQADVLHLPCLGRSFDGLIAVRLLHRIRERGVRVAMLREMARVARGPILVTYYARWNLRGLQRWVRGKHPGLSLREIRRDIQEAGLRVRAATPLRRWTQQQWFFQLEPA